MLRLKTGLNTGSDTLTRDPTRPKSLTRWPDDPWPRGPVPSLVCSILLYNLRDRSHNREIKTTSCLMDRITFWRDYCLKILTDFTLCFVAVFLLMLCSVLVGCSLSADLLEHLMMMMMMMTMMMNWWCILRYDVYI